MTIKFNKTYFVLFSILFLAEILIAKYVVSGFIRHTFGDFLVVILMYGFLKSFLPIKPLKASILVLIIAFCIESLQFCKLLEWLNLQNNTLAKLVLGSTFQVTDLLAYTLGILLVLIVEYKQNNY